MMTLTEEQRIEKTRIKLIRDDRFRPLAGIIMMGTWKVSEKFPTAATNGRDEIYGRAFVKSLNDKQLMFLVAHETYHKMLRHRKVWKTISKQNPQLANIAMDFVINGMLDNEAGSRSTNPIMEFPPSGCLDHQYDGMDTLEVYRKLLASGMQGGQGFDDHDFDGDIDELPALDDDDEKDLNKQINTAIRQAGILAGKGKGGRGRSFDELLEPQVRWQDVLTDFVTSMCAGKDFSTWARPNRRWLSRGIYQPTTYSETTKRIVFAFDTSGSISQRILTTMLSECVAAVRTANPEITDLLYWDTEVARHETYERGALDTMAQSTRPAGGGGTMVGSVNLYMKEKNIKPDCVVIFTDGYVEPNWGGSDWPAPVLWCVTERNNVPTHGKCVYINTGEF